MQVTRNGRKSVTIHRRLFLACFQHNLFATQRVMICLWRITPSRESRDAFFLLCFFSLSLFVATSFETRGTCKPSAIGSEANLKRGTSTTVFRRWSYYATRLEPPATRSFFHASPVLSRSSIFFACFSPAFLAYFFPLLSLTCFPSLCYTNDGIESSTFFPVSFRTRFFFSSNGIFSIFLSLCISSLFSFFYIIILLFDSWAWRILTVKKKQFFNFNHHCRIILVLVKEEYFFSSGFVKIKILELFTSIFSSIYVRISA